jgi:SAM-dependent methyltransferase
MAICNICNGTDFIDYNGRIKVVCATCKSFERHRLVRWVLEQLGYLEISIGIKRALHLAPEEMTYDYLIVPFGSGYVCSDMVPSKFPHAQCLKLTLPSGFDIFPDGYFNLILHNHVLEHIPGDYHDHLTSFFRILRPGGHMVFTIPGISQTSITRQGGEYLLTDAERVRLHGQSDHYKTFGCDFYHAFKDTPGSFTPMIIPDEVRAYLRAPSDPVFVFSKS